MSLDIFKQNMLSYMQNQRGIGSYEDYAKKLTQEYDAACKRGFDTVNGIVVQQGNTELMESMVVSAMATALQQGSGEHPIITNLGPAFLGYWTGAKMSLSPPPIIPAIGAVLNVTQTSNFITNPGVWQPTDTLVLEEPEAPPLQSVEELLNIIPDDNNTPEGATEIVEETDVEVLSDAGEDMGSQIRNVKTILKQRLVPNNPPVSKNPKNLKVNANDYDGKPIECIGAVKNIVKLYETNLSPNYKVRSLSLDCFFAHKIKAQRGLSFEDIVCNLKALAVNILEPLKAQYPKIRVNSAFRGTPSLPGNAVSQHEKGQAVDIQIPDMASKDYLPVAEWCVKNLPFDQIIFEHGNTIWLHISYDRNKKKQRKEQKTMINGNFTDGLTLYYDNDPPPPKKKKVTTPKKKK